MSPRALLPSLESFLFRWLEFVPTRSGCQIMRLLPRKLPSSRPIRCTLFGRAQRSPPHFFVTSLWAVDSNRDYLQARTTKIISLELVPGPGELHESAKLLHAVRQSFFLYCCGPRFTYASCS